MIGMVVKDGLGVDDRSAGEEVEREGTRPSVDPHRVNGLPVVRPLPETEEPLGRVEDDLLTADSPDELNPGNVEAVVGEEQLHVETVGVGRPQRASLVRRERVGDLREDPGLTDMKIGAKIQAMKSVHVASVVEERPRTRDQILTELT